MAQTSLKGFFKSLEKEKKRKRQLPIDCFTEPIDVEDDDVICMVSTISGGARLKSLEKKACWKTSKRKGFGFARISRSSRNGTR